MHVENATISRTPKGKRPEPSAPGTDDSRRASQFVPMRNPYGIGFRAPAKTSKQDKK